MSWITPKKRQNPPISRLGSNGFPDGWNSLPHASALKDSELAELLNGAYSQYGSISKRQGTQLVGEAMDGATTIINQKMFYDIDGEDYFLRINDLGKVERYDFTTSTWGLLTATVPVGYAETDPEFVDDSPVFATGDFINMIQYPIDGVNSIIFADPTDRVVIFNGTDWKVFVELDDPTDRPTVAKTGSGTGTRTYYYRYAWLNEFGITLASPANDGGQSTGQGFYDSMPEIDGATYLTLTLPSAPTGATRTAIYRGDVAGNEFFLEDVPASQTTYVDKNTVDQGFAFAVPASNNTPGYHFYLLDVYKDSLVGTTVEQGKDILVWSAGLGAVNLTNPDIDISQSFSLSDGAGFDDYSRGDGQAIRAIKAFSVANADGFAVFKDSRVGLLEFTSDGGGNIQNVNVIRGTMSPLSPHVAGNNIRFYSSEGVSSLGHEQNYGTILRYTVMSLKANSLTERVTPANLPNICSDYINNLSLFGISTGEAGTGNDSILVFDERYNTWSQWTGLHPSVFSKAINPDTKVEEMYFGVSDATSYGGNTVKMFTGKTDYAVGTGSGNKITLSITTKQYDAKLPDKFKKFDRVVLVFGSLFGNGTTVQPLAMGEAGLYQYPRYRISTDPTFSGFGNDEWGNQEVGEMDDDSDIGETLNIRYVNLANKDLFWTKVNIQNDGIEDEVTLIGLYFYYTASERQLPARSRLTVLA